MKTAQHPETSKAGKAYDYSYFIDRFGIRETEVRMALREIRYGSPEQFEEF